MVIIMVIQWIVMVIQYDLMILVQFIDSHWSNEMCLFFFETSSSCLDIINSGFCVIMVYN